MVVEAGYYSNSIQLLVRVSFNNLAHFTQVCVSVGAYCGADFAGLNVFRSRGSDKYHYHSYAAKVEFIIKC